MRVSERIGLLAFVVMLGVGCSAPFGLSPASKRPVTAATASPDKRLDQVLNRRSRALQLNDESMFLADLDPTQTQLVAHERMVFANVRELGFPSVHFQRWDYGPISLFPDRPTMVNVAMVVGLMSSPHKPTAFGYSYGLSLKGKALVITSIDSTRISSLPYQPPWDLTQLNVVHTGKVALAVDATVTNATELAAALSKAADAVYQVWGQRPAPTEVNAFVTRSDTTMKSWFGFGTLVTSYSYPVLEVDALAAPTNMFAGSLVAILYPMAAGPDFPNGPSVDTFERLARHELTHAITVEVRLRNAPTWAVEGYANWVMWGDDQARNAFVRGWVRSAASQGKDYQHLPPDNQFVAGGALSYALGQSVFQFVAQRWGVPQVTNFYIQMMGAVPLESVAQAMFQMSGDDFLKQWQAYVQSYS